MTLAGDYLREIRNAVGFSRSRSKFLDDTSLPWVEETLRSLEDGTNLIIVDHIRDMVKAGLFAIGDEKHLRMLDFAQRDAMLRNEIKERMRLITEGKLVQGNGFRVFDNTQKMEQIRDLLNEVTTSYNDSISWLEKAEKTWETIPLSGLPEPTYSLAMQARRVLMSVKGIQRAIVHTLCVLNEVYSEEEEQSADQ